ncbi:MAG: adenylate/guanylate cyclase domain-containing protein [Candidatus Limnocylindria bacterium]
MTDSKGTVSLVFTDIVGSTRLIRVLGDAYPRLLDDHHRLVMEAVTRHGGERVDAAGDGLFLSFPTAHGALLACVDAQRALGAHAWPEDADVKVRMGLHTGEPLRSDTRLIGIDVHRAARISASGHGGQILISAATRALLGSEIPDGVALLDLGAHRLKDLPTPEHLYQVQAHGLHDAFPPVRSLETLPNNLPRQLSTFIGRADELVDAERRLTESTVLTLTGPGGVGKTRLALQIGAHVVDRFQDGVWFVELGGVNEGTLVPDAIAAALRLKQHGSDARTSLVEALHTSQLLLILDNCEHLLEPVLETADAVLRHCPDVRLLATSREALGLDGESLMPVPSLSLPDAVQAGGQVPLSELGECDAVRLFVDRARAVQPAFHLSEANADAVAQVCRRLDGIPLAVELAAARVRMLPVQQIAVRLNDRFRLLTGGSRTSLPRHRTLRAAMDWSYDLLGTDEQAVFSRLATFSGSFSLEAAEAVCSGREVTLNEVFDILGRLVDRSLLAIDEDNVEARFRMLETIRDYAQDRLAETDEGADTHARHLEWFSGLVNRARPGFFEGPVQHEWVGRLAADHDNLRAALRWAEDDPDGATAELNLASGMWRFWEIQGFLEEGSAWLERALKRVGGEASPRRASALTGAGVLAAQRGDLAAATAFHEASLAIRRELGNSSGIAVACNNLASLRVERGDFVRARELYLEAIGQSTAGGDPQGAAYGRLNLADAASREGAADADSLYAEAIAALEKQGDEWGIAHATARLARLARGRGDLAGAATRFGEALALNRRLADTRGEAQNLASLGDVTADGGDIAAAETHYRASLLLRSQLGDRGGMASVLERLAGTAEDRPERAAVLIGASQGLRQAIGGPLSPAGMARLDQFLAGLHDAIGREAVDRGRARGNRMTPAEAVEYATAVG